MDIIPFANNSRTLCLAYYSLLARLIKKNEGREQKLYLKENKKFTI